MFGFVSVIIPLQGCMGFWGTIRNCTLSKCWEKLMIFFGKSGLLHLSGTRLSFFCVKTLIFVSFLLTINFFYFFLMHINAGKKKKTRKAKLKESKAKKDFPQLLQFLWRIVYCIVAYIYCTVACWSELSFVLFLSNPNYSLKKKKRNTVQYTVHYPSLLAPNLLFDIILDMYFTLMYIQYE